MVDQQTKMDEDSNNAIDFYKGIIPFFSMDEISEKFQELKKKFGDVELNRQLGEIGSFTELVKRMLDTHTQQSLFIGEIFEKLTDKQNIGEGYEVPKSEDDKGYSLKNSILAINQNFNGAEISGTKANLLILSKNSNVKKVFLYNSGFYIVIRAPKLIELNTLYNLIGTEFDEYGRMLGALFYMYSDMKIKDAIIDFIELLTINSNLKNWDKGNRLKNNISIHDYQLILLQIATLMYKQGYLFKDICLHCEKVSEVTIDLNTLQLTNFGMIPDDKRRWLADAAVVDANDINEYLNALNLKKSFDISDYKVSLKIPSIGEYVKYANQFNDEMAKSVQDMTDVDSIQQYLKYAYCVIYTPWIESISVMDNGNVNFVVKDPENIITILNDIQSIGLSDEFGDKISDYIKETSITNIGYIGSSCTHCNEVPKGMINGIVPIDIQNTFFSILVMRLLQN